MKRWRIVLSVPVLAMFGFIAWRWHGTSKSTIVSVIRTQEGNGVFGAPQYVIVPMSTQVSLGYRLKTVLTPEVERSRLVTVESSPCFFVIPRRSGSLTHLGGAYSNDESATAELQALLGNGRLGADGRATATWSIDDLAYTEGIGVPYTNGPCDFQADETVKVVTAQLVAGKLALATDQRLEVSQAATISADSGLKIGAKSGGSSVGKTTIEGTNVALTAYVTDVRVRVVAPEPIDLGTRPQGGQDYPFPGGLDGYVTVLGYDASVGKNGTLTVKVHALGVLDAQLPEKFPACAIDQETTLGPGDPCNVWLAPGNAMVSVRWRYSADSPRRVQLVLKSFRTSFGPASS